MIKVCFSVIVEQWISERYLIFKEDGLTYSYLGQHILSIIIYYQ